MQFNKILVIIISIVITNNSNIQASENLQVKNDNSNSIIPISYYNSSDPDNKKDGYVVHVPSPHDQPEHYEEHVENNTSFINTFINQFNRYSQLQESAVIEIFNVIEYCSIPFFYNSAQTEEQIFLDYIMNLT